MPSLSLQFIHRFDLLVCPYGLDHRSVSELVAVCRLAEVRQELPAAVDELPAAGPQAGPLLPARRGPHHCSPQSTWQQVTDLCSTVGAAIAVPCLSLYTAIS